MAATPSARSATHTASQRRSRRAAAATSDARAVATGGSTAASRSASRAVASTSVMWLPLVARIGVPPTVPGRGARVNVRPLLPHSTGALP
jgi:hypothetical protein